MPITSSAKKALRSSARKRTFNLRTKRTLTTEVKALKKLVADKNTAEAKKLFPKVQKAIDKSVKRGIIKPNAGSRKKSRLSKMVKNIS